METRSLSIQDDIGKALAVKGLRNQRMTGKAGDQREARGGAEAQTVSFDVAVGDCGLVRICAGLAPDAGMVRIARVPFADRQALLESAWSASDLLGVYDGKAGWCACSISAEAQGETGARILRMENSLRTGGPPGALPWQCFH